MFSEITYLFAYSVIILHQLLIHLISMLLSYPDIWSEGIMFPH